MYRNLEQSKSDMMTRKQNVGKKEKCIENQILIATISEWKEN